MQVQAANTAQVKTHVNQFIIGVYNWMAVGLGLTGIAAWAVANNATLLNIIFRYDGVSLRPSLFFYLLIIAELGLVFALSARIAKMKATTATTMFVVYALLNGLTLSSIFFQFTADSIAKTFFICAATFASASVFGMVTRRDLTGFGQFLFMGLIGIIIASVANIFFRSSGMQMIISYIGVFVFVGLTAYDTQKIKNMALTQPAGLDAATVRKGTIMGALSLYLDFINLFIMLLHIFGSRD